MSTPKGPSVIDQWEAEAKQYIGQYENTPRKWAPGLTELNQINLYKRILQLIELIRKKDEKIRSSLAPVASERTQEALTNLNNALALTEELE